MITNVFALIETLVIILVFAAINHFVNADNPDNFMRMMVGCILAYVVIIHRKIQNNG